MVDPTSVGHRRRQEMPQIEMADGGVRQPAGSDDEEAGRSGASIASDPTDVGSPFPLVNRASSHRPRYRPSSQRLAWIWRRFRRLLHAVCLPDSNENKMTTNENDGSRYRITTIMPSAIGLTAALRSDLTNVRYRQGPDDPMRSRHQNESSTASTLARLVRRSSGSA